MMQRVISWAPTAVDPLNLRLYCVAQASLAGSVVLAGAFAALSRRSWQTFAVLAAGCLLHLLLDATEIKWGNGVHLFAPFSWELVSFGLIWPESSLVYAVTAFGLLYVTLTFRPALASPWRIELTSLPRILTAALLVIAYLALPLALMNAAEEADAHYVNTLRNVESRAGRFIEFDRESFQPTAEARLLFAYGESFELEGVDLAVPATLSVRGTFVSESAVHAHEYHVHQSSVRDLATMVGLAAVCVLLVAGLAKALKMPGTIRS
jgi:membrane-bound metal-dependent hydrolase YbcI (DUF457 family)